MKPYLEDSDFTLYVGDVRAVLAELPDESVHCVVTSPPYWGLRDYDIPPQIWGGDGDCEHEWTAEQHYRGGGQPGDKQRWQHVGKGPAGHPKVTTSLCRCGAWLGGLGLEPTPELYVENMVGIFREIKRVLRRDGTLWLNLGDSYNGSGLSGGTRVAEERGELVYRGQRGKGAVEAAGLKPKDLVGMPWRIAFALQADGWWLRSDIIWSKLNPMPESIRDRPTKSHEYLFMLAKSERYFWDQEAVREPAEWARWGDQTNDKHEGSASAASWIPSATRAEVRDKGHRKTFRGGGPYTQGQSFDNDTEAQNETIGNDHGGHRSRNMRSVWEIATQPFPEAHFATYPEELVRRCVLAGCPEHYCGTCGAARVRITSTEYDNPGNRTTNGPRSLDQRHETAGFAQRLERRTETLGFSDCGHDDYRPGVVLDPFMGSGTTALVARKLSRHSIGIELNEDYAKIAEKRLSQLSLLA